MNNIKKFLSLLFVAVFALVLIGCGTPSGTSDEALLNEQADKIYLGDLSEVSNDIKLPKYAFGNKEFPVTWASSNTEVIEIKEFENDDKDLYYQAYVTMALEETNVTLTATVTYKELSVTREFVATVLADEFQGYDSIAAVKAKDDKEKDVSKVKFSGTVAFVTGSGFGVTDGKDTMYCYGSGHGRTVGEKVEVRGTWTYYNNMVQLASGSNVKVLGTDSSFNIANIAEEKALSEIFAIKAEAIDPVNSTRIFKTKFAAKANAAGSYNTYRLVDPLDNTKTVDVSKYNDATTIEEVGKLAETGKFYEGIVIIYCSRSAASDGLWDVLYVPGSAKEVEITLTDAQKVAGIIGDLQGKFNGKSFDANLELPTTDANYGATITWASDKEDVISAEGVYTAPANKTEVKLTATVTLNSEVQTVELTVTAKAAGKTVATLVTAPEVGVAYKLGIDQQGLGKMLFATGAMNGYYGATTEDHTDAIDVYLEAADGGYYVTTTIDGAKKYICAVVSGNYINFKYEAAPNVAWVLNAEFNTITCTVEGKEVFIGTRGTYNTIGGYSVEELAADYPVHFYYVEENQGEVDPKPEPTDKEATIAEILAAAKDLEDKAKLEGKYKVTGKVTEVTGAYSDQYKNVTFIITDGTNTLECFRAKGDEAANVAAGDTVVLVGEVQKYGEKIQLVYGEIQSRKAEGGSEEGSAIKEILDAAASLGDKEYLEGEFTLTAKVSEVTDGYSEQYKNISFKLTDGTNEILVYRAKGDEAANVKVGDTVTLTGKVQNYGGTIELVSATISARVAGEGSDAPEVPAEKGDATIEMLEANRTVGTTEQNVYVANGITITNDKAASTSNVRQDADHARFYAHTSLKIEYTSNIAKIVIKATGSGYVLPADTALEGATLTVDGDVITITLATPATSFTIADLAKQVRAKSIEIFVAK